MMVIIGFDSYIIYYTLHIEIDAGVRAGAGTPIRLIRNNNGWQPIFNYPFYVHSDLFYHVNNTCIISHFGN